jgi:hypothetical protein
MNNNNSLHDNFQDAGTLVVRNSLQRLDGTERQKITHHYVGPRRPDYREALYEVPADYKGDVLWTTGFH